MPVDDQDERARPPLPETEDNAPEPGAAPASPAQQERRRRRYITRRNAMWTAIVAVAAVFLLLLLGVFLYRSGQVDRIIANQIIGTLAQYGIRTEVGSFETKFTPRTAELRDIKLYDAQTGQMLGKVNRLRATIRIEDLYALNLRRNVNLEALEIDGLEAWVTFDAEGFSNFRNLRLPPPAPNRRILFSYSTARVTVRDSVVHYDDVRHDISGEARNVRARIQPDDPNAPAASWMNTVELALSDSTFVYDGRPVNNIDIEARGRVNQTRAEIQEVILRSPVAEARLQGTMDDWRALRYQMQVTSTVDLTQTSDWLQTETTLRGAGQFTGAVTGEGTRYRVDGSVTSDALAADGVRLKAVNVTARATGDGANYEAQGRAVAELLTIGDFQLNSVQLAGGVMGAGTDFRWLGDLRSASVRSGDTSISGLILSDAMAEFREGRITGSAGRVAANTLTAPGVSVRGALISGLRFARDENGASEASAGSLNAGAVVASGATLNDVRAAGVAADIAPNGATGVAVERVSVGSLNAAGARTGSLNIAGVRLAIRDGRVEGSSGDIEVGTVAFADGRAENVRLARPVFTVEPGGRYRASADLSLGGGVLGQMKLGAARSAVVAANDQIQFNNFTADIFNGNASGSATVSTARGGASRVAANFEGVDVGGLIATLGGRVVPVAGAATGTVDLRFPGTDFRAASGSLNAQFTGETGTETSGRTPLTGELALQAERGLFRLERANLRTAASELSAAGQFSFSDNSDLSINLASTDAAELQRVFTSTGLFPELEEDLARYGVELAGKLDFNGTLRGKLAEPIINGRASLGSLVVKGRDLGALSASIDSTPTLVRINDGQLAERDGGGVRFNATIPLEGENNIAFEATLERANAGDLVAALAGGARGIDPAQLAGVGPASGRLSVTGFPGAMTGSADLRVGPGSISGEPFEEIVARATFSGSNVSLENLEARFRAGQVTASGTFDTETTAFDIKARGTNVRLDVLTALTGSGGAAPPQLAGTADFTANASGTFTDSRSYQVMLNAEGRDVTINGQPAGTLTLVGRTEGQKLNIELTTGLLGQPQVVAASIDLSDEELPTTIETTLTGADLTPLIKTLLPDAGVRVTGRATGTLRAEGILLGEEGFSLGALRGRAEFTDLAVQIEDVQLEAVKPLVVLFSPDQITFEKTRFTGPGTDIVFGGTAAFSPRGQQNLSIDGNLNLRVLNGLSPNVFLSGTARVEVRVGGAYTDQRLTGIAAVTGASFSTLISDERLTVSNIDGRVRFTTNQAEIQSLTGTLGGGRVMVAGGALLQGLRPSQFRLNVRADDVTVPFPDNFRSTADANLNVQGSLDRLINISGPVNLRRVEYTEDIELADLINRRREASITEGGGDDSVFGGLTQLDLQVEGRDALVVRNNLADLIGSVSLRVRGPVDDPIISGRITATRGTLTFRNDRYDLTRAFIDLPPRRDRDPLLNIEAESEIRGYRVIVSLTGPLSQPQATVRSDPALPQTDVVSLITTGDLSSGDGSASTLAQSGFGTATSLLTDTLINSPVQRATDKLFGLNRFEIDPLIVGRGGASPTARLTVGRQVNRNLSITYSTNVTADQNQVVALEYRVSDRLSFVAQYQQGPIGGLRPRGNDFSFEIRFRKRI